jgi:uncharacterized protein
MIELLSVVLASLLAGFVDAVVGGGGLVLVPALFSAFPQAAPATLFGTGKAASVWGTAWATVQYSKRVSLNWPKLLPAAAVALAGSFAGAWTVTQVSADGLRRALPFILLVLLIYTLARKEMGRSHQPRFSGAAETLVAASIGLVIGFYDGFFGPGTGSFLVFLFVRVMGYDFLHASASAKLMAVANVLGSLIGTRVALARGTGFVRGMFVLVVSALILKTGWDAFGH